MKYKIGQKIEFSGSFVIELSTGKKAKVKKGDQAMVMRKIDENSGEIVYISGEASGFSQIIKIKVDDNVDAEYLANKIMQEL